MNNILKKYSYTLLFILTNSLYIGVNAQTKDRDKLEENEQVNVVQDYKPTIADANKLNDNPIIKDTFKINTKLNYTFLEKQATTNFKVEPISAANIKGDILTKLQNNYFRVGLGNYNTPFAEAFYTTTRSKTQQMGIHAKHLSSSATIKDLAFSGYSDNQLNGFGKFFVKDHTIYTDVNYTRNAMHYYGSSDSLFNTKLNKNDIKQVYNYIGAKGAFESNYSDTSLFNYSGKVSYYYLQDVFGSAEQNAFIEAGGTKKINNELYGGTISYDYFYNSRSLDTSSAGIVRANPYAKAQNKKWRAKVGFNLTAETDIGKVHFFPDIDFNYNIINDYMAGYAVLNGYTERNSYKILSDINPFISPSLNLKNTNTNLHINGGLRGKMSANLSYDAGADYKVTKDLPLFVNYSANVLQNKFITVYDDVNILNVYGLLAYQTSEKLFIYAKGNVYNYKTTKEVKAWHKPKYDVTLSARYSLKEKIVAKVDVFFIGSQFAKSSIISTTTPYLPIIYTKTLKGVTDVNLGLEYRYTKRLSAFINFNNIAAMRYQRWNNYPTYRFNLLGGVTFCF